MSSTLIKNGKVVSTTGVIAQDVLLDGDTIRALGAPGYFTEEGMDRVIDAAGKYVIPGGIDVHTHMELPFGGTFASDTFETGSRAAAWGGTTTIIDMAVQKYGEDVHAGLAAVEDGESEAEAVGAADVGEGAEHAGEVGKVAVVGEARDRLEVAAGGVLDGLDR